MKESLEDNLNSINIDKNKEDTIKDIYIISCFHNILWEKNLIKIISPNKSVISIVNKSEEKYDKKKNYLIILY